MQEGTGMSLLVLAAGMGSRFGGLKQMEPLGPNGETILDYSVYDAISSGFTKVVFVIREFFAKDFKKQVTSKFEDKIDVRLVFQDVNPQFDFLDVKLERTKPWGTNHAIYVAQDEINEPFAVINADDYYGRAGFFEIAKFLKEQATPTDYCMVGYPILNTLSDSGTVNRGVCKVDGSKLVDVVEMLKISKEGGNKVVSRPEEGVEIDVPADATVSMNFWGFHHNYFDFLEKGFFDFVKNNFENPKSEYFIPTLVDELIKSNTANVHVLTSADRWYGITYQEDKNEVIQAFDKFQEEKVYPAKLWE